jgi:hypothetical protein
VKARYTRTAGYRGALALQYEIVDDDGAVLRRDYVLIHPKEGETFDDLKGILQSFSELQILEVASEDSKARQRRVRLSGSIEGLKEPEPVEVKELPVYELSREEITALKLQREAETVKSTEVRRAD